MAHVPAAQLPAPTVSAAHLFWLTKFPWSHPSAFAVLRGFSSRRYRTQYYHPEQQSSGHEGWVFSCNWGRRLSGSTVGDLGRGTESPPILHERRSDSRLATLRYNRRMAICLLGLGSNLDDRVGNLLEALRLLKRRAAVLRISSLHETLAVGGPPHQANYLNAAAVVATDLPPVELLAVLSDIEATSRPRAGRALGTANDRSGSVALRSTNHPHTGFDCSTSAPARAAICPCPGCGNCRRSAASRTARDDRRAAGPIATEGRPRTQAARLHDNRRHAGGGNALATARTQGRTRADDGGAARRTSQPGPGRPRANRCRRRHDLRQPDAVRPAAKTLRNIRARSTPILQALSAAGCDCVFVPHSGDMYPPGFSTFVEPPAVSQPLEGVCRPGHFRGVATIVLKLFQI